MPHGHDLSRRDFLERAAWAAALGALGGGAGTEPQRRAPRDEAAADGPGAARPPNVLLVLSDSHRSRNLGCYGDEQAVTPTFDALAEQGTLLETAVASTPLCRPYRASLMTGSLGHHNGLVTNRDARNFGVDELGQWRPGALPTLAGTLRAAGYRCGYVGKWHLGRVGVEPGELRFGFDDWWAANLGQSHDYFEWHYATGPDSYVEGKGRFRPAVEVDQLVEHLREAGEGPWFMMLSWGPPHSPFTPPKGFDHYRRDGLVLPANVTRHTSKMAARNMLAGYYGLIEAIDAEFDRVLDALDELGRQRDTIVIYTSDHGHMLGSHGFMGKEMPYVEATGVPFIVRWPGRIPAGVRLDMPFGTPDIMPTLCGLAGLEAPAGIDGRDFSGVLLGQEDAPRQEQVLLQMQLCDLVPWPGWRGVRTARHLYAARHGEPWLLFDLVEDPWELRNLAQQGGPLREELDERLRAEMERVGDRWG